VAESAPAHAQQQHGEVLTLGAERAVTLDHLHLSAVHQSGAPGGHPDFADGLGHLGTAFHRCEDLGVQAVYLDSQGIDICELFGGHIVVLLVWGVVPLG